MIYIKDISKSWGKFKRIWLSVLMASWGNYYSSVGLRVENALLPLLRQTGGQLRKAAQTFSPWKLGKNWHKPFPIRISTLPNSMIDLKIWRQIRGRWEFFITLLSKALLFVTNMKKMESRDHVKFWARTIISILEKFGRQNTLFVETAVIFTQKYIRVSIKKSQQWKTFGLIPKVRNSRRPGKSWSYEQSW